MTILIFYVLFMYGVCACVTVFSVCVLVCVCRSKCKKV